MEALLTSRVALCCRPTGWFSIFEKVDKYDQQPNESIGAQRQKERPLQIPQQSPLSFLFLVDLGSFNALAFSGQVTRDSCSSTGPLTRGLIRTVLGEWFSIVHSDLPVNKLSVYAGMILVKWGKTNMLPVWRSDRSRGFSEVELNSNAASLA